MGRISIGQIVGAIVGAVIGGPYGFAAAGFSVGFTIGGILQPPGSKSEGPRLDDLSLATGAYSFDIPSLHGRIATNCPVIWIKGGELQENSRSKTYGGGIFGGGSKVKTYSYSATFAVIVSRGSAGSRVGRIWINGEIFYNGSDSYTDYSDYASDAEGQLYQNVGNSNGGEVVWRYLDGSQTIADTAMIEDIGADAPNLAGWNVLIFDGLPLADYGNSIPQLKVEIIEAPTWDITKVQSTHIETGYSNKFSFLPRYLHPEQSYGVKPGWDATYPDPVPYKIWDGYLDSSHFMREEVSADTSGGNWVPAFGLVDSLYEVGDNLYIDQTGVDHPLVDISSAGGFQFRNGKIVVGGAFPGTPNSYRVYYQYGKPDSSFINYGTDADDNVRAVALSDDGSYIYVAQGASDSDNLPDIIKYDLEFNEISRIKVQVTPGSTNGFGSCTIWHDQDRLYWFGKNDHRQIEMFDDNLTASYVTFTIDSFSNPGQYTSATCHGGAVVRVVEDKNASPERIYYEQWNITNGGETYNLSNLVERICGLCGVTIDTTELDAQSVTYRGYRTTKTTARNMLDQLQSTYLFDIIEDGYDLKCITRSDKTSSQTIPWTDYVPQSDGTRVKSEWEMADQLPYKLELSYYDPVREYDSNTQYSYFPTSSKTELILDAPASLTADEAAQLANKLIKIAHAERQSFEFRLPLSYLGIKPADLITIETEDKNYLARVEEVAVSIDQSLSIKAGSTDLRAYASSSSGESGSVAAPQIPLSLTVAKTTIIDAAMVFDDQDEPGYLAGMYGQGNWTGGTLYRSTSSEGNFDSVQGFTNNDLIIGFAFDSLSSDDGYELDHTSTLSIRQANGTFPTGNDVLLGEGLCFYGADGRWEVLQYSDAATESDGTITLSGPWIRGRKGTEWATGLHENGDTIIYVDPEDIAFVTDTIESVDDTLYFLGITNGLENGTTDEFSFTYGAENLTPLSPVLASSSQTLSDGTISIDFIPRTRFNVNDWWTGSSVATESAIAYEVDILDSPGGTVLRTITSSAEPVTYTGAQIVSDFGSTQADYDMDIYQISSRPEVGRGRPGSFTLTPSAWQKPLFAGTDESASAGVTYDADLLGGSTSSDATTKYLRLDTSQATGQFVIEFRATTVGSIDYYFGIYGNNRKDHDNNMNTIDTWGMRADGAIRRDGSFDSAGTGISWSAGDYITMMVDIDAKEITWTKNNNVTSYTLSISTLNGTNNLPVWPVITCTVSLAFTFEVETDPSAMQYASTLHPGILEVGNE